MKKKIILIALLVLVLVAGTWYYISPPHYLVHNSYSMSNGSHGTRDTELEVIIYRYHNYDQLFEDIRAEHCDINGEPTSLEINLYLSKWHLLKGKIFKTRTFAKENP